MTPWIIAAAVGAVLLAPGYALSADHEAGVPLTPAEAAGAWTLESSGRSICVVTLGKNNTAKASAKCGDALPIAVTGWQPTADGMELVGADGRGMAFGRWSNSLFVAHRATGVDVQLRRGGPGA